MISAQELINIAIIALDQAVVNHEFTRHGYRPHSSAGVARVHLVARI